MKSTPVLDIVSLSIRICNDSTIKRIKLNRKMNTFLYAFAPENLASRDGFSRTVPHQSVIFFTLRLNLVLDHGILPDLCGSVPSLSAHAIPYR